MTVAATDLKKKKNQIKKKKKSMILKEQVKLLSETYFFAKKSKTFYKSIIVEKVLKKFSACQSITESTLTFKITLNLLAVFLGR